MQTPPAIGAVIYQFFDALTYSIVYIIAAIVLLSDVDFRLTIPLLIWLFAYLTLSYIFIPKVGEASQISSDARSSITGRVVDSYTNIQSVKLFAHHDKEEKYAKEAIEYTRQKFFIEMRLYSWMALGINFINGALLFSVIGWSIYLWSIGSTTIGVVAATTALALRLASMSDWLMWAFTTLFQELGVISEGMETIAQEIDLQDEKNASKLVIKDGSIDIKNIWHHYGKSTGGLNGISLKINGGEKVGIVGRSGAGKSSLVNLILRFHELETGTISIDSQNIKTVTQNSLRANIGMVTQDSSLLHRSVRDNILYGKPEASEEQIIAAAKQAEAWEFIPDLQDTEGRSGLDAQVGERGVKLSGGQRQRISIARVIIKDAPILILDEATSALDSEVEAAIQDTLNGLMHGKTVIAIAHRLSTIAQMDRIIVLEDGKIAEEGSHKKLLDQKGLYYAFWKRQSGGFIGIDVP
jgi:ATP-binding cassette subfamily B multidrug efflux pump